MCKIKNREVLIEKVIGSVLGKMLLTEAEVELFKSCVLFDIQRQEVKLNIQDLEISGPALQLFVVKLAVIFGVHKEDWNETLKSFILADDEDVTEVIGLRLGESITTKIGDKADSHSSLAFNESQIKFITTYKRELYKVAKDIVNVLVSEFGKFLASADRDVASVQFKYDSLVREMSDITSEISQAVETFTDLSKNMDTLCDLNAMDIIATYRDLVNDMFLC